MVLAGALPAAPLNAPWSVRRRTSRATLRAHASLNPARASPARQGTGSTPPHACPPRRTGCSRSRRASRADQQPRRPHLQPRLCDPSLWCGAPSCLACRGVHAHAEGAARPLSIHEYASSEVHAHERVTSKRLAQLGCDGLHGDAPSETCAPRAVAVLLRRLGLITSRSFRMRAGRMSTSVARWSNGRRPRHPMQASPAPRTQKPQIERAGWSEPPGSATFFSCI